MLDLSSKIGGTGGNGKDKSSVLTRFEFDEVF
jgi:hypothetical protein